MVIDEHWDVHAKNLDLNGFAVVEVPELVWLATFDRITTSMSKQLSEWDGDKQGRSEAILKMQDADFRATLGTKTNRFICGPDGGELIDWAEATLVKIFPHTRASCSTVSPREVASAPHLNPDTPDFFYRCVRPGSSDVGPAHRDCDFWDAYIGTEYLSVVPTWATTRWKLWMPVSGWNESTALTVIPRSHREKVEVEMTNRAGNPSAQVGSNYLNQNQDRFMCPISPSSKREAIFFHDKLVHRAPANSHTEIRLSCEMTLFSSLQGQ